MSCVIESDNNIIDIEGIDMKKYLICLGVFLCLPITVFAETTVSFDPPTVTLGESTELVIETDRPLTAEPDLSALTGNFAVAGQQQGVRTVSINGRRRTKYRLALNVFPRKEGELSTGELLINGLKIKAAVLKVEPAGTNINLPITFTASVNQNTVYPDETFLLKMKLTHGVALLDAKIMQPTLENAQMTMLDMDKTSQEYQDGRPVSVFERTFAITPEKSGFLTIPGIEVYAIVPNSAQDNMFSGNILFDGLLGGQKEVRLESNAIQVTVLEKPTEWSGWWLPATQVAITAQDNFPDKINVGDSLTRTIKLTAIGTEAEKLPVPKQSAIDGVKVYPSPEQRETIQTPVGDIQGIVNVSYILVPSKAGKITIPEVRVPWFNTYTRQTEEAILPSRTITVLQADGQTVQVEKTTTKSVQKSKKKSSHAVKKQNALASEKKEQAPLQKSKVNLYWIIGCSLGALMIGIGLGFILFRRKKHHSYRIPDEAPKKRKKKKPLPDLYPF